MDLQTYVTGTIQTKAYRVLREQVYGVLSKYDLTPTSWGMLGILLTARDGIRQSDIAEQLSVKPPMITVLVRAFQEDNLIKSVTNQFDSRAKLVTITPKGKKLVITVEAELSKMLEGLLQGVTREEMIVYHKVLTTIIANAEASSN